MIKDKLQASTVLRSFLRASDSQELFNISSDVVINTEELCNNSIDDILGQCRSPQEVYDTAAKVCSRVIDNGFFLSEDKLRVGTTLKYSGFVLNSDSGVDVEIKPDPKQIEAILGMRRPETKKDFNTFLGMVQVLHQGSPDITLGTELMKDLVKTQTNFLWTDQGWGVSDLLNKQGFRRLSTKQRLG